MRLIYLFHSGFLIEAEDFSIIFDYYRGGENIIEKALRRRQPMYVLVSHEHRDHYNPEILTLKNLKTSFSCFLQPYRRDYSASLLQQIQVEVHLQTM